METNILKMISIADIVSIANAVSGLCAIFAILNNNVLLCAKLLLLAVIFDCIDGTLARRFNDNSPETALFGETIDSLSDIVSFGVAPAVIIYLLSSGNYWISAVLLLICGLLRLTRYNTIQTGQTEATTTFIGLPIPISALLLGSLILSSMLNVYSLLILMIIISVLMISNIEYPKIKNNMIIIIIGILVILAITPINEMISNIPSTLLIILSLIYIIGVPLQSLSSLDLSSKIKTNNNNLNSKLNNSTIDNFKNRFKR